MFPDNFEKSIIREANAIRKNLDSFGTANLPAKLVTIDNTEISFTINKFEYPYLILSENKRNYTLKMYIPFFANSDVNTVIYKSVERMLITFCSFFEKHEPTKMAPVFVEYCDLFNVDSETIIKGVISGGEYKSNDIEIVDTISDNNYLIFNIKRIK